jgi:hypothetical protein
LIVSLKTTKNRILLEGNQNQTFQCENPIEKIEKLMNLALNVQLNFNWQQFINQHGNQMYEILEFRISHPPGVLN